MYPHPSSLLLFCVAIFAPAAARASTNLVAADVTSDVTWSGTNLIQGTVTVRPGVTVNIDPGTRMLMNTGAVLRIQGALLANGTSNAPISFTRRVSGQRWGRLLFVRAGDSRLHHCVIEFSDSAGTHLDYYDNDCNTNTVPPNRTYHEAVVALATRLDLDGCIFRNLPDTGSTAEGDALAIVSDDPQNPGPAAAEIRNCQFLSIGQGVHTRHSYVLVENCRFSGKRGDNDDVDLYGESTPPPLIRNNTFLSGHEDKINPTRCSAIIIGNFVSGSDDHGIVLRDKCRPIVVNNLFSNCTAAAISVQNQCDALIANNTIVNCGRGVRLFDHTARWGTPYCLNPGSGRATIVNCILWNTPISFDLSDSPYPEDRGSHIEVYACDVAGGQPSIVDSGSSSTVLWGPGNFDLNPQLASNLRPDAASPCLDVGTNVQDVAPSFSFVITRDYAGAPRPLDGNGDGQTRPDMGAYEFLLSSADSNADGIPDGWTWSHGLDPTAPDVASGNPDGDPHTTWQEWVADTNPTNALSHLRIATIAANAGAQIRLASSPSRRYTLLATTPIAGTSSDWLPVPGQSNVPGLGPGGMLNLSDTNPAPFKVYRVDVQTP